MIRGSLSVNTPVACPLHDQGRALNSLVALVARKEWLVWKTSIPALEHISATIRPICYAQEAPEKTKHTHLVASVAEGKRHYFLDMVGTTLTKHLWGGGGVT